MRRDGHWIGGHAGPPRPGERCLFNRPAQSEAWAGIPPLRVVSGSFADLGGGAKKNRSKLIGVLTLRERGAPFTSSGVYFKLFFSSLVTWVMAARTSGTAAMGLSNPQSLDQAVVAHRHYLDSGLIESAGISFTLVAQDVAVRDLHQRRR